MSQVQYLLFELHNERAKYEECRDDALILSKQVEDLQKALEEIYIHTRTTELANLNWIAKQALKGVNRSERS